MKRKNVFAASGSKVVPWTTFAATVPPVTFAWYQRTVALPVVAALQFEFVALSRRRTVWATQSDSAPPMFEYCACAIARIASTSAAFAGVDALGGVAFGQQFGRELRLRPGERRGRDLVPVDVELVDRERVQELLGRDEVLRRARGRRARLQAGVRREDA